MIKSSLPAPTRFRLCSVLSKLSLLCIGCLFSAVRAQEPPSTPEHPYMLFPADQLEEVRERFSQPRFEKVKGRFIRNADQMLTYSGEGKFEGDPATFESRAYKTWAQRRWTARESFLWAFILTGEPHYRDALLQVYRHEWKIRDNLDQNHFNFEFTAKIDGYTAALTYDMLRPHLSEKDREAFVTYLSQYLVFMSKPTYGWKNNIGTGYFSAVGLIALALLDDLPEAPAVLQKCIEQIKAEPYPWSILPHPDGAYPEGALYMDYMLSKLIPFVDTYERVTGDTEHGLLDPEFFQHIHRFAETYIGGDGGWIPFYDSQPQNFGAAWLAFLGKRCDNQLLRWAADHFADRGLASYTGKEVTRSLPPYILYHDWERPVPFPGLPTLSMLPSVNTGAMRSEPVVEPGLMVAVRGFGENEKDMRAPHKDVGSFVLYARGENFLIDPGYKQPESPEHSLPQINGMTVQVRSPSPLIGDEKGSLRTLSIDPTRSYRRGNDTPPPIRRTWVMAGDKAVILVDDIQEPAEVISRLQAGFATEIQPGGTSAVIAGKENDLWLGAFGPELDMIVTGPLDFGDSWEFKRLEKSGLLSWHRIEAAYQSKPEHPMVWVFVPREQGEGAPEVLVRHTPENIFVRVPGHADVVLEKTSTGWQAAGLEPRPGSL